MGKRFRGKDCVYCGGEGISDTADHVFAREFFPVEHRSGLPKVPTCAPCNRSKAVLEHYLLSVLPFGGRHPASNAILSSAVPRRLAKNVRLHQDLAARRSNVWVNDNGFVRQAMTLPFDGEKLAQLFIFITKGMVAHHWQLQIPQDYFVGAGLLTRVGEAFLNQLLGMNANARVSGSLGAGLVQYEGAQAFGDPSLTIWRFELYGGIQLGGDPLVPNEAPSQIWATSSRDGLPGVFDTQMPEK